MNKTFAFTNPYMTLWPNDMTFSMPYKLQYQNLIWLYMKDPSPMATL